MVYTIAISPHGKQIEIHITTEIIDNIFHVAKRLEYTIDEFAKAIGFAISTCKRVKSHRELHKKSTIKFIEASVEYIIAKYPKDYTYNENNKKIEPVSSKSPKQFEIGTYYGYFKKENSQQPFHFVLFVKKHMALTLYSQLGVAEGVLKQYDSSYSAVLTETEGERRHLFLIGNNSSRSTNKIFIGTWSDDNGQVISSLCFAVQFKTSKYDTVEKIKKDEDNATKELIEKMPTFVEKFFNEQSKRYIIKQSSIHETGVQ